jgi:hypothetical protein
MVKQTRFWMAKPMGFDFLILKGFDSQKQKVILTDFSMQTMKPKVMPTRKLKGMGLQILSFHQPCSILPRS